MGLDSELKSIAEISACMISLGMAISSVTQLAVPLLHTVRQRPRISPNYRAD
jgi:hypothetical protein